MEIQFQIPLEMPFSRSDQQTQTTNRSQVCPKLTIGTTVTKHWLSILFPLYWEKVRSDLENLLP